MNRIELGQLCMIKSDMEKSSYVYPLHFVNCKFLQNSVGEIENLSIGIFTEIQEVFVENGIIYYKEYNFDTRETVVIIFDNYNKWNICKFCLKKIEKAIETSKNK